MIQINEDDMELILTICKIAEKHTDVLGREAIKKLKKELKEKAEAARCDY